MKTTSTSASCYSENYPFYVLDLETNRLHSGWEFVEDAQDAANEAIEAGQKVKLINYRTAKKLVEAEQEIEQDDCMGEMAIANCEDCGKFIDESDLGFVGIDDDRMFYFCEDCTGYCDTCEREMPRKDLARQFDQGKGIKTGECQDCSIKRRAQEQPKVDQAMKELKEIAQEFDYETETCSECKDTFRKADMTTKEGKRMCEDCSEEYYQKPEDLRIDSAFSLSVEA